MAQVNRDHIHLLRSFSRHPIKLKLNDEQRDELWNFTCRNAGLPMVTYKEVVDAWRAMIVGDHKESRIAITPTVDPLYVTIAVCLGRESLAAHTGRVDALIASALAIYADRAFSPGEMDRFLDEIKLIATAAWKKAQNKPKEI